LFAPSFASWDSLPGTANDVIVRDLTPGQSFVFAIVAFDEAGAWSSEMSLDRNLLRLRSDVANQLGPVPSLWNDVFRFDFPSGGVNLETHTWPEAAFAAGIPIPIHWSARTSSGTYIKGMRWAVDLARVDDETPRADEQRDLSRWSRWSTGDLFLLPPFEPAPGVESDPHLLYVELVDNAGLITIVGVRLSIVRPSFSRDLLVIDDTRLAPDRLLVSGCTDVPSGFWPTSAELDTFLYAVGGVPWRCYPTGTMSSPGILAGYSFDTLGTRFQGGDGIPLGVLARYRNIIWIVDLPSALSNNNPFNAGLLPMPWLRSLSQPGAPSPLATWLQLGGRLWLLGGGAAYASLRDYDGPAPTNVFSADAGELVAGRLMYNAAHWRSEITVNNSFRATRSPRLGGGWPGAPDYSILPTTLAEKTPSSDPVPPARTASRFYASSYYSEYMTRPNSVIEPSETGVESALDTLYVTQSGASGSGWPVMTLYHGAETPRFVFSGFPLWYFQRSQAIALTDFVLQNVFGLSRAPVPR
jgi:hypothetical protein